MQVNGQHFRTIWPNNSAQLVEIIDQTKLPFAFEIVHVKTVAEMVVAIKSMQVRGAPLIGAAAAYGMALACNQNSHDAGLLNAFEMLKNARPTAVNLEWALNRMLKVLLPLQPTLRAD